MKRRDFLKTVTVMGVGAAVLPCLPQQASSATDNGLDDYEQGTFTPMLSDNSGAYVAKGIYTKVGNTVHFSCKVQAKPNNTQIMGLPFKPVSRPVVSCLNDKGMMLMTGTYQA